MTPPLPGGPCSPAGKQARTGGRPGPMGGAPRPQALQGPPSSLPSAPTKPEVHGREGLGGGGRGGLSPTLPRPSGSSSAETHVGLVRGGAPRQDSARDTCPGSPHSGHCCCTHFHPEGWCLVIVFCPGLLSASPLESKLHHEV